MSKLNAALTWATRGFPVFPLLPNSKEPAYGATWYDTATTDPAMIQAMWTDPVLRTERDWNIGVDCTNFVVVDIDVKDYWDAKNAEFKQKDGYNQYLRLGGTFNTLVVQTPTGGLHVYFQGPDSANVNIAQDIEIRSHHGYVVAPGSTIDGVPYVVRDNLPMAYVPHAVDKLLKRPDQRKELQADIELDTEANIQAGKNFLETAELAIEGQRGDETTFIVAARLVRELGLSPYAAYELMRDHWNERCSPPWELDELQQKVGNAAAYGTADLGRLDPSVMFGSVNIEPPPSPMSSPAISWGNAVLPSMIRPRPWLVDRLLMLEKVTVIGSAGGSGKSSAGLALAAHLALGLDFGTHKTHGACKSIVYNGEDDVEEQSRRLLAVCETYGFNFDEVRRNIMLLSYEEVNMKLVTRGAGGASANQVLVDALVDIAKDPDIKLIILDPLVDLHTCDEGDSSQMNVVMATLQEIAKRTLTSVLLMHHATKAGSERQEQRIGNMDIFRGSSAIVYKSRVAFTLMDASQQDAEDYGMQDSERHTWTRLDDAKMNLTLRDSKPLWFRKVGVRIVSGDVVGVLHHQELTKSVNHIRIRVADVLIQHMMLTNSAHMTITQAIAIVRNGEPLWANLKDLEIKSRLENAFTVPVQIREKTLQVLREKQGEGKAEKVTVVLK